MEVIYLVYVWDRTAASYPYVAAAYRTPEAAREAVERIKAIPTVDDAEIVPAALH